VRLAEVTSAQDLCVDPDSIEALITPRTRAIFVVHFAGFPCRMDEIVALADEHGIPVVEDAAHAVFGRHRGRTLGLHGRVGCYSFYSNKNATCGEGGALVTDDDELARRMRLLRSHGMTTPTLDRHRGRATSYDVLMPGYNMRLDEIRAALLRVQLGRLPGALKRRRELFRLYAEALAGTPVELPFRGGRFESELDETAVHILPVLLPEGSDRDAVMARMKEAGVQTSIHYPPVHHFACYATAEDELPRTTALAKRELTLPFFPALPDTDVPVVVDALLRSLED
jgi:dTDP-4-amino-4,6-dideoxygalactose transaminase